MSLLDRLEQKLARFAVPHVTLGIILAQVVVYCLFYLPTMMAKPEDGPGPIDSLLLYPVRVLQGEVWRLFTFIVVPPLEHPFFAILGWYFLWLMGRALENEWGTFRYNLFLLVGYLATVGAAFVMLDLPASNTYFYGSIFLAFAFLYPDFEILLFFLLPVKVKWIARITWGLYALSFLFGNWSTRLVIVAAVSNFLLFFGKDVWERIKQGHRSMTWRTRRLASAKRPAYFHRCVVCGITDRSHPDMDFRYCSKCAGACGYCSKHLHNHEHVTAEKPAVKPDV